MRIDTTFLLIDVHPAIAVATIAGLALVYASRNLQQPTKRTMRRR